MRPEDTLETNCSIQVDVSCWDRTGVPTTSHTFQSNITLSCQYIRIHYFYYHFILSANSCSFLSLSLYLFSTFMFILIIITLSCQHIYVHSYHYHFIFSKRNTTVIFFVQSRFNKQCKNTFCFPLNLLSWTANFNFSVHILVLKKVMIMAVELLFIFINDVDRDLVCP